MSFQRALRFTLRWEGGARVTRDPDDPGGTTKYGISQRANPDVDVENLTRAQAAAIYRERYWDRAGCEGLEWPLSLAVFDLAVNAGVSRAKRYKRETQAFSAREAAYRVTWLRMAHLLEIARKRPRSRKYVRGWMNRVSAVFEEILA